MTPWIGIFTLLATLAATDQSPRSQYEALVKGYETNHAAYIRALNNPGSDDERVEAQSKRTLALDYAPHFFALADEHPDDPAAIDALTWIASHCMFVDEGEKALRILALKHSESDQIEAYVGVALRYGEPFAPFEDFLRAVLKNNSHRKVQAAACMSLAAYLKMAKEKVERHLVGVAINDSWQPLPESLENLNRLKERGLDKVGAESEALFERVIEQYGDVWLENNDPPEAGLFAKEQLFELRNLSIGNKSLEIDGKDLAGKAVKLSDCRGQVVVLDFGSHRTCGVCRTIYADLRTLVDQFEGKPFALIGINSGDDIDELKGLTNDKEITWRVVWDGDGDLGPITSRWVIRSMPTLYVLDGKGVIRNKGLLRREEISGTVDMLLKEMAAKSP